MDNQQFDIIIIGGGATGLGCALEATLRGYKTLLIEEADYGSGTSSKSTKLVHGGLRYLANFDLSLVKEGLLERHSFIKNAPHLAKAQSYLIPFTNWPEKVKYFLGIKLYDRLAGKYSLGQSRLLNQREVLKKAPDLNSSIVKSGAIYYDGQFDDTRLLITLVKSIEQEGGMCLNYTKVTQFITQNNKITQVTTKSTVNHKIESFSAKYFINATGTFSDEIMNLADPKHIYHNVAAARGSHIVLDKKFFNTEDAILIPKTFDNRVLFILPWNGVLIIGTTDIIVKKPNKSPQASIEEVKFILETFNQYSQIPASLADVLSVFSGERPLVKPATSKSSAKISRRHEIFTTPNGLINIVGGKWTIYRKMAEDTINYLEKSYNLIKTESKTQNYHLYAYTQDYRAYPLSVYGAEATKIIQIQTEINNSGLLNLELPHYLAEVYYHIRYEQAKTIADILARRTRSLFLNAKAAISSAPIIAEILAQELNYDSNWINQELLQFKQFAKQFQLPEK